MASQLALASFDLWGKYEVTSVNGRQYYILFIDEWSRYITVKFLESKSQEIEVVKKYLSHRKNHDGKPCAIRVDGGKDIITDELRAWCAGHEIAIQVAPPHSPLQNCDGVLAEQMNRTHNDDHEELAGIPIRAGYCARCVLDESVLHN